MQHENDTMQTMTVDAIEDLSWSDCVEYLTAHLTQLKPSDTNFALSLLASVKRARIVSEKQEYWVRELTKRTVAPSEAAAAPKENLGDMTALNALFDKAKQHLKYPKVVLDATDEQIKLSIAGPNARVPGSINVVGRDNAWYGRILSDGQFEGSRKLPIPNNVKTALVEFAKDPVSRATLHGQKTGNCCFCARELTDSRSIRVGYGPICADHYGLPWD